VAALVPVPGLALEPGLVPAPVLVPVLVPHKRS